MINGRPPKDIDKNVFENLCAIQCTAEEIAAVLGVARSTLWRWCKNVYGESFKTIYAKKREKGFASLRRAQFRLAEKNAVMAIWLGKQYLGQTDKDAWQRHQDEKLLELKERKVEQDEF